MRSRRDVLHSITVSAIKATTENPISSTARHSEEESANNPKAAPWFSECTISKNPGITTWVSNAETRVSMIHLVRRSMANTAPARPYIAPLAAGSRMQNLIHGAGARGADRGVSRIRSDVGGVLPAALAFAARGSLYLHLDGVSLAGGQLHLRNDKKPR